MRFWRRLIVVCVPLALIATTFLWGDSGPDPFGPGTQALPGGFLVHPYLQPGDAPAPGRVRVLWVARDVDAPWTLEHRTSAEDSWKASEPPAWRRIAVPGVTAHRVYRADLTDLKPGSTFTYRVRRGDDTPFQAEARAPKSPDQPHRFVVFGDCGAGSTEEMQIANQAFHARPDLVLIPGDIVYTRGRIREYAEKFWPFYNADQASPASGAPLLRSTLFVASVGNHDTAGRDLASYPDGLAYFYYWDQPVNGPELRADGPNAPPLIGPEANRKAFLQSAGDAFPRMLNFSFNHAGAHWTILDSDPYVDWTDPVMRDWLARDLESAKEAAWRFVLFHHPPFNSSRAHFGDQRLRVLADVFEAGHVDVVWSGHVHNYQRTYPMTFLGDRGPDGRPARRANRYPGRWTLDTKFDGRTNTQANGVIYVITGGGGASLYYPEQEDDPTSWQPYTSKLVAKVHSLTVADVDGPTLTVRQIDANGHEVDRFVVTRDPEPESQDKTAS